MMFFFEWHAVAKKCPPPADDIRSEALPKTRSGKLCVASGQVAAGIEIKGDTPTLVDFNVLAKLASSEESFKTKT